MCVAVHAFRMATDVNVKAAGTHTEDTVDFYGEEWKRKENLAQGVRQDRQDSYMGKCAVTAAQAAASKKHLWKMFFCTNRHRILADLHAWAERYRKGNRAPADIVTIEGCFVLRSYGQP